MIADLLGLIGKNAWKLDVRTSYEVVGWRSGGEIELCVLDVEQRVMWRAISFFDCFTDAGEGKPRHLRSVPKHPS